MDAYKSAGVDYDVLDAAKREAIAAALRTSSLMAARGGESVDGSRGEPAFVFKAGGLTLAHVVECLGTKSTLARQWLETSGEDRFDAIGYDTVATVVNDLICVGALPLVVNAYFATGAPEWLTTDGRFTSMVTGFERACRDSGAVWGGGETPTLSGIVAETEIDLAGSGVGVVPGDGRPVLGDELEPGDEIVFLASTGVHTNGLSLARQVAARLSEIEAVLPSGRPFVQAVLDPSAIYVPVIAALADAGIRASYLSHITGHGFRKILRANRELTYRITAVPEVPEVLSFLAERAGLDDRAAYGTFNMGAGFAVYCRPSDTDGVLAAAAGVGLDALRAGVVEEGPKRCIVEPINVVYGSDDLALR